MNDEAKALVDLGGVPDARAIFSGTDLNNFGNLVSKRIEFKNIIKLTEDLVKEIDTKLTEIMVEQDAVKVQHDGYKVSLCQGSRSSLSKEKLLEAGVAAVVIQQCTTTTQYSYLLINSPKEKV